MKNTVSRATIERIPIYIEYLKSLNDDYVSATTVAKGLSFGEVQVRKDLGMVSGAGRPRIGYETKKLISDLEHFIGKDNPQNAVIVGAGKLGMALLGYNGFEQFGVKIAAAFDCKVNNEEVFGTPIYPVARLCEYCKEKSVRIGIITVPAESAQEICDIMVETGITAIWNFAPTILKAPEDISIINEKLALSLNVLRQTITPVI